ncbi:uncharacterized protein LOC144928876 [Branchiostoma floridae x Branchiostoma belcheri]
MLGLPCGSRLCRLHYPEAKRTPQCCCPIPPTGSHSGTLIPCPARLLRVFRDMADVTNGSSPDKGYPPLSSLHPPISSSHPSLSSSHPPLPSFRAPISSSHPPLPSFRAPLSSSHPPLPSFRAPLSSSHPPLPSFRAPISSFHSPISSFHPPHSSFHPPSPASIPPTPAPSLPSPAPILPSPAPILPSPAPILPSPASTLPSPASTLPSPASILPTPASILPCPASTLPCPAPILPPAVQQVIRTLTSAGPAIQAWENELLLPLIRRQLAASCDGQTVSCKTGGQPIILRKLTKARKATTDVTPTTVRRRVKEVETARKITSRGDTALQLTKELQRLPREDLQAALKAVKLDKIRIPAASLLSAKTDLSITWHQTREMKRSAFSYVLVTVVCNINCIQTIVRLDHNELKIQVNLSTWYMACNIFLPYSRWLVQYGISVESEKESRRIAGELLSPHGVVSELLPFTAKDGDNCLTVKLLPAASVQCLSGTIEAHVRQLEAAGLPSRPEEPVEVRVFAAGDYALLSLWYGLSGPSGKRPCLWCETAKESMTLEPEDRELILRKRTLERLDMHYRQFQEEGGGNISKAKLYKNVIAPYMFNVPLDQVCTFDASLSWKRKLGITMCTTPR